MHTSLTNNVKSCKNIIEKLGKYIIFLANFHFLQVGKFGGKGKGGLQQAASNNSSVSGLDQLNMSDKDINVSAVVC